MDSDINKKLKTVAALAGIGGIIVGTVTLAIVGVPFNVPPDQVTKVAQKGIENLEKWADK